MWYPYVLNFAKPHFWLRKSRKKKKEHYVNRLQKPSVTAASKISALLMLHEIRRPNIQKQIEYYHVLPHLSKLQPSFQTHFLSRHLNTLYSIQVH